MMVNGNNAICAVIKYGFLTYTSLSWKGLTMMLFLSNIRIRKSARYTAVCALLALSVFFGSLFGCPMTVYATLEELEAEAEARRALPIQSNDIDNWPGLSGCQRGICYTDGRQHRRYFVCQKYP